MSDPFNGFQQPGYTAIPNELLDTFLPILGEAELRVALFIARKTFGWHKRDDDLSLSQIAKGTGLSNPAIITATASLVERGLLVKRVRGKNIAHNYRLNVITSKDSLQDTTSKDALQPSSSNPTLQEVVNEVNSTSKATLQQLVKPVYTQKKVKKPIEIKDKENKSLAASAAPPPNPEPVETEAPKSNPTPSKPKVNEKERPTPAKTEPLTAGGPKRTPAELARANAIVDRLEVRCKTSRKIASSGLYDVAWKILGINPDEDGTGIDTAYGDPPPDIPRTQWNWWLHDYRGRGDPEKNRPPDYPKHYQVLETYLVSREPVRVSLKLVTSNKSRGTPGANGDPNIDGIAQARARYEARENKHNGPMIEGRVIHG